MIDIVSACLFGEILEDDPNNCRHEIQRRLSRKDASRVCRGFGGRIATFKNQDSPKIVRQKYKCLSIYNYLS